MGKRSRHVQQRREKPRPPKPMKLVDVDHPILHTVALFETPDDEWHELGQRLVMTARHHNGIAVAAPQVGVGIRLVGCASGLVLLNPQVHTTWGQQRGKEGCLSLPNRWFDVVRSERVTLGGLDPKTGMPITEEAVGLYARCWQHEIDHLDGILISDRWPEIIEPE